MSRQPNEDQLRFIAELANHLRQACNRPGLSAEERGRNERWLEQATALQGLFGGKLSKRAGASGAALQADLPEALVRELSPRRSDQLESQLIAVIGANNGSADLDEILIGLYRGFGVIGKRRVIQNKLWRLVRTGRLGKAKDKRNVFALNAASGKRRKNDRAERKNRKVEQSAPRRASSVRRRKR